MMQREPNEKEKRIINRLALEEYRRQFTPIGKLFRSMNPKTQSDPLEEFRLPYPDAEIAKDEDVKEITPRRSDHDLLIESLGGKCRICGSTRDLEKHHIVPLEKDGPDIPENLVVLCRECHVKTF